MSGLRNRQKLPQKPQRQTWRSQYYAIVAESQGVEVGVRNYCLSAYLLKNNNSYLCRKFARKYENIQF
jgi:hypothetical protein